jgi:hypothetical protein
MGYRSDVGLCLSAKGKEALDAALAEAQNTNEHFSVIKELLDCGSVRSSSDDGAVAYHWQWLKWYADYYDVSFIENLLRSLDDEDYLFIRVGESDDDTEYQGGFWNNPLGMCLVRGIAFD